MNQPQNIVIFRNTILLYARMLVLMLVHLYVSRLIIRILGAEDYGIFNVIGGLILMLGVFNNAMSSASQRFLAYELGQGPNGAYGKVFNSLLLIHTFIAIISFLFAETVGLWFFHTQLKFPCERIISAYWVYQFTVFSLIACVFRVPFLAGIMAHEKMAIYAYISFLEGGLSLLFAILLPTLPHDKLILYGFFSSFSSFIITLSYIYFSIRCYPINLSFVWDKKLIKAIIGFTGWNFLGVVSNLLALHGSNILLNVFFGPLVNAARAIAFQIKSALQAFYFSFFSAVKPQIFKSFSSQDFNYMRELVYQSSKYSYFLMWLFSLPMIIETRQFLELWLGNVPNLSVEFCRLVLLNTLIDCLTESVAVSALATGNVKKYQICVQSVSILVLPITYLFFYYGYSAVSSMYISILISFLAMFVRLFVVRSLIDLSVKKFFAGVVYTISIVSITSLIIPLLVYHFFDANFFRLVMITFLSFVSNFISIFVWGLSSLERGVLKKCFLKASNVVFKKASV